MVVNPVSLDTERLRSAVAAEEDVAGWLPSVWLETAREDAGRAAAKAAAGHDPAVVIVAGGDGTVRAVAEHLHSTGIPMALVPAGTGNLLARNLGLMTDIEEAVHTAFTGGSRQVDVGTVTLTLALGPPETHTFAVMCGVGLDARMADDTNSDLKRRIGWLAYVDPISRSVLGDEHFRMTYRVDGGRERSVQAHTVIVGNCGSLTGGMVLLPEARPDDGLLDVVLLRPKGFWQWLRVGTRLGIGGLLHRSRGGRVMLRTAPELRALRYVQARRLTARFDHPQSIELDGDGFGSVTAVTLDVRPAALTVRIPSR